MGNTSPAPPFRTEFLLRLCDCPRGGTSQERDVPEAPLFPEHRVKQFVRENRLAQAIVDADWLLQNHPEGINLNQVDELRRVLERVD